MAPPTKRTAAVALMAAAAFVSLGTLPSILATAVLAASAVFTIKGHRWPSLASLAVAVINGLLAVILLLGLVLFILRGDASFWTFFFLLTHGATAVLAVSGALVADHSRRAQRSVAGTGRSSRSPFDSDESFRSSAHPSPDPEFNATTVLKSFGKSAGSWGVRTVKATPKRFSDLRKDVRDIEERGRRLRRASEDQLIREEKVAQAKESRRRRTGSIF